MALPATLKAFTTFLNGKSYLGRCSGGTPPDLALKVMEYRDGGMDAPVEMDVGMNSLNMMISLDEPSAALTGAFGTQGQLTLRGSYEGPGGTIIAIEHYGEGLIKEVKTNEFKAAGEKTGDQAGTMNCQYYRLTHDGQVLVEVDLVNGTRAINGVDQLAGRRAALGL